MGQKEILNVLIDIHNKLLGISVKGEDVMRMSDIIKEIRSTVASAQELTTENIGGDTDGSSRKTN